MSVKTNTMQPTVKDATPVVEESCPAWCEGCDDDGRHVTDFSSVYPADEEEALVRLVQDGAAAPVVELGVNDADGDSAALRLSVEQARELADLIDDLIAAAELG